MANFDAKQANSVLKMSGMGLAGVVLLVVAAGAGPTGSTFATVFILGLWLVFLVFHSQDLVKHLPKV